MKLLLEIITNPTGIAINIVHWAIVGFAFLTEGNPFVRQGSYCHCEYPVFEWLIPLNIIPVLLTWLTFYPIDIPLNENDSVYTNIQIVSAFLITFQWSLVGLAVKLIIDFYKLKKARVYFR